MSPDQGTPQDVRWSFGAPVMPAQIADQLAGQGLELKQASGRKLGSVLAVLTLVAVAAAALRRAPRVAAEVRATRGPAWDAFVVGAAVYVSAFVLGASFNYRQIHLLLCAPLALEWRRRPALRTLGTALLVLPAAAAWLGALQPELSLPAIGVSWNLRLDGFATWLLFAAAWFALVLVLRERLAGPRTTPSRATNQRLVG